MGGLALRGLWLFTGSNHLQYCGLGGEGASMGGSVFYRKPPLCINDTLVFYKKEGICIKDKARCWVLSTCTPLF